MATLYTNQHTIPTYGRVSGYCSYSQSNGSNSTTISVSALGEAWMNTSGYASTYTLYGTRTVSITFRGTTYSADIKTSTSMNTPAGKAYVYNPYSSFSPKTFTVDRASTQKVYDLILKITIGGSTYTGTVSITVPAAATPTAPTVTIRYEANGGSGSMNPTEYTYASSGSINLRSNTFTRSGYTFLGWSLSSTATTATYSNGQAWSLANDNANHLFKLYAIWKQNNIYVPSKFGTVSAFRSNSNGTQNNNGTYGHIEFNLVRGSYGGSALTSTTASYKYKRHDLPDWQGPVTLTIINNSTSATFGDDEGNSGALSVDYQYDIQLILTDIYDSDTATNITNTITYTTFISASACIIDINADGSAIGLMGSVTDDAEELNKHYSKVYVQNFPLYHWTRLNQNTKVPSGSSVIDLDSPTKNFSEIMIVAEISRSGKSHILTVTIPEDRITTTAKEIKLGGGEGTSTGTNCGAWGEITTTDFKPVTASINNATYLSDTDWYIYGR